MGGALTPNDLDGIAQPAALDAFEEGEEVLLEMSGTDMSVYLRVDEMMIIDWGEENPLHLDEVLAQPDHLADYGVVSIEVVDGWVTVGIRADYEGQISVY